MLDALFSERVTVFRLSGLDVNSKQTYAEVKVSGVSSPVKCRIETTRRRVLTSEGAQAPTDAQMLFRRGGVVEPTREDVIKTADGKTFRLTTIDEADVLNCGRVKYARATLTKVSVPLP